MNDSLNHKIFTETECISEQTMFDYIDKKLSEKENHMVEKHLLHCDLCSDALEGLEIVKDRSRIAAINQKILEKISPPLTETKVVRINYKVILSVAASILLLVGGVFFFNILNHKNEVAEFKSEDITSPEPPPPPPPGAQSEIKNDAAGNATPIIPEEEAPGETNNLAEKDSKLKQEEVLEKKEAQKFQVEPREQMADAEDIIESEELSRSMAEPDINSLEKESAAPSKSGLSNIDEELRKRIKDVNDDAAKKPNANFEGAGNQDKAIGGYSLTQTTATPKVTKPAEGAFDLDDRSPGYIGSTATKAASKNHSKEKAKKKADSDHSKTIAYAPESIMSLDSVVSLPATVSELKNTELYPQYPGGQDSLINTIRSKFSSSLQVKYPQLAKQTAEVRFTIDKKGNLKNPAIVKGLNTEMDKELIRVLKLLPKWLPGSINGEAISKEITLSVRLSKE